MPEKPPPGGSGERRPPLPPRDSNMRVIWWPTGNYRLRQGFFGSVIEVEESRETDMRPPGACYSDGWWQRETRWRRARRNEVFPIINPLASHPLETRR